ncbi:hypothetical protein [Halapricum desulfuricans]|uniref:Putative membrane protein n=1 Tax=Halapricum desulfuricans TaxID=2841257 RepID=A0A897MWC8_9EURY|nr:hypothetical protein [Halapricum desulfuricans]QSG06420.1 putative membrane protein [Halapricum desulfuricans]
MSRPEPALQRLGRLPALVFGQVVTAVEAAAFWGSILLPLGYLAALALDGPLVVIVALIGANIACLLVGHRHQPRIDADVLASMATEPTGEADR